MTLQPFWLGYVVVLLALYVWAGRLLKAAEQRDADTTEREIAPLLRSMEGDE